MPETCKVCGIKCGVTCGLCKPCRKYTNRIPIIECCMCEREEKLAEYSFFDYSTNSVSFKEYNFIQDYGGPLNSFRICNDCFEVKNEETVRCGECRKLYPKFHNYSENGKFIEIEYKYVYGSIQCGQCKFHKEFMKEEEKRKNKNMRQYIADHF